MTDNYRTSLRLRRRVVDIKFKKIRLAHISLGEQANDAYSLNCKGYGRLRTTPTNATDCWNEFKIPYGPAANKLGVAQEETAMHQSFQVAGCNLRCWFCFVDDDLVKPTPGRSEFFTSRQLIALFLQEQSGAKTIVLTGGEPSLVPEWPLWMMQELDAMGLSDEYYLWLDTNLNVGFTWSQYLQPPDFDYIRQYNNFGCVGCFKSYNPADFAINSGISANYFGNQFSALKELVEAQFDVYSYIILAGEISNETGHQISIFIDRLQREIHHNMPLRLVPLEIKMYSPTLKRMNPLFEKRVRNQFRIWEIWQEEIQKRFSSKEVNQAIYKNYIT